MYELKTTSPMPTYPQIPKGLLGVVTTLLIITSGLDGSIISGLDPNQINSINQGKEVLVTRDMGKTWPEVIIYKKVNANANSLKDLFIDYENASTYIPSLKSARIENSPSKDIKDVRYTVRLPIILSISYLVRNKYEKTELGHKVSWNLLESAIVNSAQGSLTIEPIDPNSSVICYRTHIEPATRLVSRLKGHAIKEASLTVEAIVSKAESLQK